MQLYATIMLEKLLKKLHTFLWIHKKLNMQLYATIVLRKLLKEENSKKAKPLVNESCSLIKRHI